MAKFRVETFDEGMFERVRVHFGELCREFREFVGIAFTALRGHAEVMKTGIKITLVRVWSKAVFEFRDDVFWR